MDPKILQQTSVAGTHHGFPPCRNELLYEFILGCTPGPCTHKVAGGSNSKPTPGLLPGCLSGASGSQLRGAMAGPLEILEAIQESAARPTLRRALATLKVTARADAA